MRETKNRDLLDEEEYEEFLTDKIDQTRNAKEQKITNQISKSYRKAKVRVIASVRAKCIATCTANNTHLVISQVGRTLRTRKIHSIHKSAGLVGFKGTKRGSPYAAEVVAEAIGKEVKKRGVKKVDLVRSGLGRGRNMIVKGLGVAGLQITSVSDGTPLPHGGCRSKKVRRV